MGGKGSSDKGKKKKDKKVETGEPVKDIIDVLGSGGLGPGEKKKRKLCKDDFEFLTIIGRGAFGEVWIAKLEKSDEVFALKRMLKKDMVKKHQTEHIRAERNVLALADNPWIVKLHYSFQDFTWLYLAMEFLQGGDLMTILIKKDILSHEECSFYMAELCMAVQSVHMLNYIHRDLKPDNILFDAQGHLKLSDFGLCKSVETEYKIEPLEHDPNGLASPDQRNHSDKGQQWKVDRRKLAHSMVGTPDYMAPEIFTQKGYGTEVDWWSIGVIMYECLVGYAPFYGEQPVHTARKIVKFEDHFIIPSEIELSPSAEDLMRKLVARQQPRKDFVQDFEFIKTHPFFSHITWETLREGTAVIVPKLKNKTDAAMFDDFEPMQMGPDNAVSDQADGDFVGYTYKLPDDEKRTMNESTFQALGEGEGEGSSSGGEST